MFKTPKRHILARNRVFWRILREGQCVGLGCGREEEPPKTEHFRSYISPIWGEKTPGRIGTKFCTEGDIQDVITDTNLGDDRLNHFYVARGQILCFSIGFRSRPYNTLALPCECVIYWRRQSSASACDSVCLSARTITQKRMIPNCSKFKCSKCDFGRVERSKVKVTLSHKAQKNILMAIKTDRREFAPCRVPIV